jgi:methyltransferase (TIGR00027 family)
MSIDDQKSETAMITASLRALSNYEKCDKINCHDFFAEYWLPEERKSLLQTEGSREIIKRSIPKGMYEYVIARTKYFDDNYVQALQNEIEQIVFLGAGYDSRPYRFSNLIKNTKIFELDTKPTQLNKLSLLQKNGIAPHRNISFVSVDFERDDFLVVMSEKGFDKSKQTLFLWEGVTFYLSYHAVIRMLRILKENSIAGCQLCFDFQTTHDNKDLIKTELKDETIKFGIPFGEIDNFVKDNGYTLIEHINSNDMEKRFLTLENGDLFGPIMPIMNFILIEHN